MANERSVKAHAVFVRVNKFVLGRSYCEGTRFTKIMGLENDLETSSAVKAPTDKYMGGLYRLGHTHAHSHKHTHIYKYTHT